MQAKPQEVDPKATTPMITAAHLPGLLLAAQFFTERGYDEFTLEMHILGDLIDQARHQAVPKGWSKEKPSVPGAYYVKGFRLGEEDYRPALVDVALDEDGELVCNIHLSNSDDDLDQWSFVANCSGRFEWLGPLLGGAQ